MPVELGVAVDDELDVCEGPAEPDAAGDSVDVALDDDVALDEDDDDDVVVALALDVALLVPLELVVPVDDELDVCVGPAEPDAAGDSVDVALDDDVALEIGRAHV